MRKPTLIVATMFAACCAHAQSPAAAQPPPPPCQDEVFHQFDFWIGAWEVFGPQGKKAGDNTITREEYGCLLVEHWVNTGGQTGQSYNFYDLTTDKWRQVWVSAGAVIDYAGGLDDEGRMVLEGTIGYPGGAKAPFRGTWTPNADGTVTQYFQQYDAEKKGWTDWFTGTYRRKE